jgi:hypothetical protein
MQGRLRLRVVVEGPACGIPPAQNRRKEAPSFPGSA